MRKSTSNIPNKLNNGHEEITDPTKIVSELNIFTLVQLLRTF